eukprot:TRINITY_DN9426_c0_g1_i18.p1 TRINITY_DN9426_c0_g1~~TRINITY_DN9426_c0_g1_i18.p1  ORF type:complete len:751 (-),score=132.92 TRINITY_DN9426_c0_g1_i18:287-2539(-)
MIATAAAALGVEVSGDAAQAATLLHCGWSLGLFGQAPPAEKLEAPLGEAVSRDPAVQEVLEHARRVLLPHLLKVNVEIEGWTADQVARLIISLQHYAADFSKDKWDLGYCKTLPFRIVLRDGAHPVADRPYRYSPQMTALIRVEVDKLLAAGIIRPSQSAWSSPVVGVMKPDGTARITVNYRRLNAMSIIPKVPIPMIEDIFNALGGAQKFLGIDISGAFFVSAIDQSTIPLTAMATSFGLYEWTRCSQGAAGAPGHFTRLMEIVLQGLDRVQSFIDDVIVHSPDVDTHIADLQALMERMRKHGIKLAPAKMHIGCTRIKFLGHIVETNGIRPDPEKVSALLDMPIPEDLSALRSWLGLANYYRRFVKNMAEVIAPLTALMSKDVPFVMSAAELAAIEEVSMALSLHALMVYPDHVAAASGERPFILATDASKLGFGAVVSQSDVHGVEHPIAFASRATLKHQKNWTTTDLEAGAVVFGVKKFRHILWGTPFVIDTDHRALLWLESCKDKTARLARWFEFLGAFPHTIRYKAGERNGNADGFSRNPMPSTAADAAEEAADELLEAYTVRVSADPQRHDATCRLAARMLEDLCTKIHTCMELDSDDGDGNVGAYGSAASRLGDWSRFNKRIGGAERPGVTHMHVVTRGGAYAAPASLALALGGVAGASEGALGGGVEGAAAAARHESAVPAVAAKQTVNAAAAALSAAAAAKPTTATAAHPYTAAASSTAAAVTKRVSGMIQHGGLRLPRP